MAVPAGSVPPSNTVQQRGASSPWPVLLKSTVLKVLLVTAALLTNNAVKYVWCGTGLHSYFSHLRVGNNALLTELQLSGSRQGAMQAGQLLPKHAVGSGAQAAALIKSRFHSSAVAVQQVPAAIVS